MIVVLSVLYGAAIIFILLRTVSKVMTRTFWMEDYIIISATVLAAAPFACVVDSEYPPSHSQLPSSSIPHVSEDEITDWHYLAIKQWPR